MVSEFDLTKEDLEAFEAENLVKRTNNADDLVHLVVEDVHHHVARAAAAKKLIDMYLDGNMSVNLGHLAHVGDHADEPYKTQTNDIIRNHL